MSTIEASKNKHYTTPSLTVIGRITALTGMFKLGNYLDNSNGSDAWQFMGS